MKNGKSLRIVMGTKKLENCLYIFPKQLFRLTPKPIDLRPRVLTSFRKQSGEIKI
jgi:hypothetical protein